MSAISRITRWGDTHHPVYLDVLRMGLGVFLFYKGWVFSRDADDLQQVIAGTNLELVSMFLTQFFIPLAHFAGGLLIAMGLMTRLACAVNIPILAMAVALNGTNIGVFNVYEFGLSIAVLALLIVFLVIGSGPLSAEAYMKKYNNG